MILIVLIVVTGFVVSQFLHYKHITRLELLLKAQDLQDIKDYEEDIQEELPNNLPASLLDVAQDKSPEEVLEIFRKPINGNDTI